MSCEVCCLEDSKYKCTCLLRYCSLNCFKEHRSTQECRKFVAEPQKAAPRESDLIANRRDYPREDVVPPRLLEYLKTSQTLRESLGNPHLRELIRSLASERDPSKTLDHLMKEPLFVEFADACLDVIEPQDS
ncbi:zinc finger HIT domain-containing protein 3 [Galendromus occidentalis]|uniref:Zinc finger HIT domain-containing protein 3 n=1 Tax=Galendromus occidentalis TaxID=34638 RepID=A0AAJ6VYG0_9ACAR|nr:zinc finger HIT domain-containing protein 3 [Galendromus occidentalis]